MSLTFKTVGKGRILFANERCAIRSFKNQLFVSYDEGDSWEVYYTLPCQSARDKLKSYSHILSRLFRFGFHHFVPSGLDEFGIIFHRKVVIVSNKLVIFEKTLKGSRPLSFSYILDNFLFGEYRSNPKRSAISVYGISRGQFEIKHVFKGIRHIHGVYQDPYTGYVWITTGDTDNEAAIYCTEDEFKSVKKIIYGSQQTRTIKLLFTKKHIYYGSDAPDEGNYLYQMDKEKHTIKQLAKVGSSVFHGCKVGDWLFFSTAIEPSHVNKTKYVEVWASPNGNSWKCLFKFKKDIFPMKYFQYGQVFFNCNEDNKKTLWMSPFCTKLDNKILKISLNDIEILFNQFNTPIII